MSAEIIDGKKIAEDIRSVLAKEINSLDGDGRPGLAVVLIGSDPASEVYVRMKKKACADIGVESYEYSYGADYGEDALLDLISDLNEDPKVNGILVQLPLPAGYDEKKVIEAIAPEKDVDGFHPQNVGRIVIGDTDCFLPCTPYGCQILIKRVVGDLKGKHVVIVGRSNLVGKPLANMLIQKSDMANCIVTVCHSAAADIGLYTRQADILVAAAGSPGLITADMVKPGAVVIDVGTTRIENPDKPGTKRLAGDVDFESVSQVASAITPVPGGVGPMTITMLLSNTVKAYKMHNGIA
ncbi:MAG: bifunctional methylenetetrahydrofolate dehydrogenase/methenyltetrahydrofolate cyclohydrolase FolD [Spirochaetes bacterium]|jgi:methylenetetrahydrofolate dehydrogenase (NADP+)/methenyltetrahydrofolate cyclohydrolase|nr:bifunctional methylenetetrahydrofolate dehydrogenase/methenyltetrahydrofolate cyclohydrolase FolD [Spirochaetota bacterium]